jgi:hypothetical protein
MAHLDDYGLRLARKCVDDFAQQDALMEQHREAVQRRDCEELPRLGIEAAEWLGNADKTLRTAAVKGISVPEHVVADLASLFRLWLRPVAYASECLLETKRQGFTIENQKQFESVVAEVQKRVAMLDMADSIEDAFQGNVFNGAFWNAADQVHHD